MQLGLQLWNTVPLVCEWAEPTHFTSKFSPPSQQAGAPMEKKKNAASNREKDTFFFPVSLLIPNPRHPAEV